MKYLVLLAVVLVVFWLWRGSRRGDAPHKNGAAAAGQPQDMVECPVCRVHLPRADALPGPDGRLYCCSEHRLRAGG
jgi:uncharacterized protein